MIELLIYDLIDSEVHLKVMGISKNRKFKIGDDMVLQIGKLGWESAIFHNGKLLKRVSKIVLTIECDRFTTLDIQFRGVSNG